MLQSICVLGYCIFPINVAAIIISVLENSSPAYLRFLLAVLSFLWSTKCKIIFTSLCEFHVDAGEFEKKNTCDVPSGVVLPVFGLVCSYCMKSLNYFHHASIINRNPDSHPAGSKCPAQCVSSLCGWPGTCRCRPPPCRCRRTCR